MRLHSSTRSKGGHDTRKTQHASGERAAAANAAIIKLRMPLRTKTKKQPFFPLTASASAVTISSSVGLFLFFVAIARAAKGEEEEEEEAEELGAFESGGGDALVAVKQGRRIVVISGALVAVLLHPALCCWQGEGKEDDDGADVEATPAERIL